MKTRIPIQAIVVAIAVLSLACSLQPAFAADTPMDLLVTADWLREHLDDPGLVVLDCTVVVRMDESGGMRSVSGRASYLAGHIPGAINIPVLGLLDATGRFRPLDEPAAAHPDDRADRYITYCGGGIAASGSAFVMVRLGFEDVAVYTVSLQDWAADPDNPMVDPTP